MPGVYTNVEAYGPWIEETILAAKGGGAVHVAGHKNDLHHDHSTDENHRHGRRSR